MQIRYHCPTDLCVAIIEYAPLEACGPTIRCPRCRREHPIHVTQCMRQQNMVDRCAVCRSAELFIRKDFPQRLGLFIVVIFGLVAVYYFRVSIIKAFGVLAAAVLVDLAVYLLVGKVTTCYACRAEYRRCKLNPAHDGFDLGTAEKY